MKKILLIGTGGTIACTDSGEGLAPTFSGEMLLSYTQEVAKLCEVHTRQILSIDSTNIQPEYWINMVDCIEENYHLYDGFVITHGTDTMAYTSAALSYMIQNSSKPIIITGAQKSIALEETDARRNLLDAITFACEDVGGVFIVFNGKVINGARAEKVRTKSYNAFESINFPYIAIIDGPAIQYNDEITKIKPTKALKINKSLFTNIFLLKLIPGIEPAIFDYIKDKYQAIIIESYGSGGIPFEERRNLLNKIKELTDQKKIVVITTQVLLEGSDLGVYEVGRKALKNPIIPAHDMTTEAIVTKLMWSLGQTQDVHRVKEIFLTPIHSDLIISDISK